MKIWLVTIGEPVPVQEAVRDRLQRSGYFAHFLAERGHQVTWWTSTFDHYRKQQSFARDTTIRVNDRLEIRLLRGCGYRRNLSLARFWDHRQIARKFRRLARTHLIPPSIVMASLPTIELGLEAVQFGRMNGVPVVLDMRDMWPDIFVDCVPSAARPFARVALWPMFQATRLACRKATAIIGHTEEFVDWGLRHGSRVRTNLDRAFPFGYASSSPGPAELRAAESFWDQHGISAEGGPLAGCFIGTIGRNFDLHTIVEAARRLRASNIPIRFVFCGCGDQLDRYKEMAVDVPNVLFSGWVNAAEIHVLMRRCAFGLDPLPDRYDFLATINNKAIEYLSAGLPVISTPRRGLLAELLADEGCGMSYDIRDVNRLVSLLSQVFEDSKSLEHMAANARRVFRENFTAEQVYHGMMTYLEQITIDAASTKRQAMLA